MRFEVVEIDTDYKAFVGAKIREFDSEEQAKEWCKENSYGGFYYYCRKVP